MHVHRSLRGFLLTFVAVALLCSGVAVVPAGASGGADPEEPPTNPYLGDSPWPMAHRNGATQASSPYRGPEGDDAVAVQHVSYGTDAGITRSWQQTSPWLLLSSKRYADAPDSRALYAVTLTDLFKYRIDDGGAAQYVDHVELHDEGLVPNIMWNFLTTSDDRLLVPSPEGSTKFPTGHPCRKSGGFARIPTVWQFRDAATTIGSSLECEKRFELTDAVLDSCVDENGQNVSVGNRQSDHRLAYSGTNLAVTTTGDIVASIKLRPPGRPTSEDPDQYFAVLDSTLSTLRDCRWVDSSPSTNNYPVEAVSPTQSAIYVATEGRMVKMVWDTATGQLERRWARDLAVRFRTGTTPTMMGFGDDRFVAIVDAPCAVEDPFTGTITCSDDTSAARVLAVRRDDDRPDVYQVDLPPTVRTVENSPSARGFDLVVADYGGYEPVPGNTGVAAVRWDPAAQAFELSWVNDDIQMNGVTSISAPSNLVYSSGVDAEGDVHLYGVRLRDDLTGAGGEVVLDIEVAEAGNALTAFDQGNNVVISDDRSLTWATAQGFVRVTLDNVGGTVSGTVTSDGAPVGDGFVGAYAPSDGFAPSRYAPLTSDGGYTIDGLAPGTYRLLFVPELGSDLRLTWQATTSGRDQASPVTVADPATALTGVDIDVPAAATIAGTVEGPDGTPVGGVAVKVYRSTDTWLPTATATTAADGSFVVGNLAAGTYALRLVPPAGSGLVAQWHDGAATRGAAVGHTVAAGGSIEGIVARLAPA